MNAKPTIAHLPPGPILESTDAEAAMVALLAAILEELGELNAKVDGITKQVHSRFPILGIRPRGA